MFKFRADHPFRPLNWRWERARIVCEHGKSTPGLSKDDEWVSAAVAFRKMKDNCSNELSVFELYDEYPEIAMAYEIWDDQSDQGYSKVNPMRHEIEARILARESLSEISSKAGVSDMVIDWYEKLFFNVCDRIDNKMYIFHVAIGEQMHKNLNDRDYPVIWKLYAYVRGSAMLDYLITTFSDWTRPSHENVERALLADHKSTMRRKAALSSRMIGINNFSSERLIDLQTKIREIEQSFVLSKIERKDRVKYQTKQLELQERELKAKEEIAFSTANVDASSKAIHNNIQVMLSHLPMIVGPQNKGQDIPAEFRADEIVRMMANKNEPKQIELDEFKFPEQQCYQN